MKKSSVSIKWKLFAYLTLFVALMLAVLWLFQTVFLNDFYKFIKTRQIESAAAGIQRNLESAELLDYVANLSKEEQICSIVLRNGEIAGSHDVLGDCLIHRLNSLALNVVQQWAYDNGGVYMERFTNKPRRLQIAGESFFTVVQPAPDEQSENVVYVTMSQLTDGTWVSVILNSAITPVSATVDTLRIQLTYISIVVVALALLVALLISRQIARPVVRINSSARHLATGNPDLRFEGKGYKEVEELSDTLNRAAYELSRVETLRRELIANVSHDLRTPLTMISGFAEVMRDLPSENTPENAQVIIDEANRLTRLVSDLLDLSKMQSGVSGGEMKPFPLTKELDALANRFNKLLEPDNIRITLEFDADVWVTADETQLPQAIYNLVANAAAYTSPGNPVEIKQTVSGGNVKVSVTDYGPGIAPEDLPHIWERYYKVDKEHRRAQAGSGLGLSIVRGVLERHEAEYGVDTTPGKGCTFWFILRRLETPVFLETCEPP